MVNLCLVSRDFYLEAAPVLYSYVSPNRQPILLASDSAPTEVKLLHRTVTSNPKLASFIKSLVLQMGLSVEEQELRVTAQKIIENLKNLTHLHVRCIRYILNRRCLEWLTLHAKNLQELKTDLFMEGPAFTTVIMNNPNLRYFSASSVDANVSVPESYLGLKALETQHMDPHAFSFRPWNTVTCLSLCCNISDIPFSGLGQLISFKFRMTFPDKGQVSFLDIFEMLRRVCAETPKLRFIHLSGFGDYFVSSECMVRDHCITVADDPYHVI